MVAESTPRAWGRMPVLVICALVVAMLFGTVAGAAWQERSQETAVVRQEQRGVVYLHPLIALVGLLVQAQTDAVRGAPIDTEKVRKALSAVSDADAKTGRALGASQRFGELDAKTEAALTSSGPPPGQYATWTDIVALALDLVQAVGDSSTLGHDQDTDAFYLARAALIQLPDAVVQAGRAADLATLAGGQHLSGDDAFRVAVARYAVAVDGEASTDGLNRSIAATQSHTLGANVALQLDAFRAAVATFTPPTALGQSASMSPTELVEESHGIYETALPLNHTVIFQLNGLLRARAQRLADTRRNQLLAFAGVAAAYVVALLTVVIRRRRQPVPSEADPPVSPAPAPRAGEPGREAVLAGRTPPYSRGAT